jgi:hypothetical protein
MTERIEYYEQFPDIDPDLRELVALVDDVLEYDTPVRVTRLMASVARILEERFGTTPSGWASHLAVLGYDGGYTPN